MAILKPWSSRPRGAPCWRAGLLLCLALLGSGRASAQYSEHEIKAAFLFNFAQFATWPTNTFASTNAPFVIGIYGPNPFQGALEEIVRNERIQGHPLRIQPIASPSDARQAHILYIHPSADRDWPRILREISGRPVLTVSDMNAFARRGGMIQLYTENKRVRLRINRASAEAAGLALSSKLLRVAEVLDSD